MVRVKGWESSTTAARPIGNCPDCGGMRYENLVHHCGTVRLGGFAGRPYSEQPSSVPSPGKRTCPTCQGTGINPVWMSKICPKCNGERTVPV